VISFDIAALNVRRITDRNTTKHARIEPLHYVTRFYSSNPKAATSVIAPSVVCRYRFIHEHVRRWHVAAKECVTAVIIPI